jgi:ABC-type transport system substrate-binding protein
MDFVPSARDILGLAKDAPQTVIIANELTQTNLPRQKFGKLEAMTRPWKDARVRIALRRAIDHPAIAATLSGKDTLEAGGIPVETRTTTHMLANPAYWLDPVKGELGEHSKNYLYDQAEARKLMAAAGYSDPIDLPFLVSGIAETMYQLPGRDAFTDFSFRWPWLHNANYLPATPYLGGHLHWLDIEMPNREQGPS